MGFLNGFFYGLIQLVAKALNIVVAVCGTLSGIPVKSDGTFPGAGEEGNSILINLLTSDSGGSSLAIVFGGLCIVTGLFSIFFAIIETLRTKAADGVSLYKPYADFFKSIGHMFLVSSLFLVVVMIIGQIGLLFSGTFSGDMSMGGAVLSGCFDTSMLTDNKHILEWDALWANGNIPSWDKLRIGGVRDTFNVWQALISIFVIVGPMIGVATYLAKRLINILLLLVTAPISFSMYPIDEGHAKTEWYKDMKGALLGGVVIMVMFYIFIALTGTIYGTELVKGDTLMNGIMQSIVVGAGVSVLIPLTKQVLKYFGCDDALLATASSTFTPKRAFGAIKNGVKGAYRAGKGLYNKSKEGGEGSGGKPEGNPEGTKGRTERTQAVSKTIARSRMVANSGGIASSTSAGASSARATKPAVKPMRSANLDTMARFSKASAPKPTTVSTANAPIRAAKPGDSAIKMAKPNAKVDNKKGKDSEALIAALEKFVKSLAKILKPYEKTKAGELKPVKIKRERKVSKIVATAKLAKPQTATTAPKPIKIERKREIKPIVKQNITQTNSTKVDNKITNTIKPNTNVQRNKMTQSTDKEAMARMERKINESITRIKRVNTNISALPRTLNRTFKIKPGK